MTNSDFTKSIVALACWRAAPTEPHQVMLYVAMVFRNRAAAGWYEGDLYENCWRWLEENDGLFPDPRDPQFQQLIAKLDGITADGHGGGLVPDKTYGALYFAPMGVLDHPFVGTITTTVGKTVFVR